MGPYPDYLQRAVINAVVTRDPAFASHFEQFNRVEHAHIFRGWGSLYAWGQVNRFGQAVAWPTRSFFGDTWPPGHSPTPTPGATLAATLSAGNSIRKSTKAKIDYL